MPTISPSSSSLSSSSYRKSQMTRATALETQLSSSSSSLSEEESSNIRIQLCEVFADLILTCPKFALANDCFGRMWRHCFYARIQELKARIAKEKKRRRNQQHHQQEAAARSSRVVGPKQLETNLKQFLKEAITLYNYLVQKYESKLLPPSLSSSSLTPPDDGKDDGNTEQQQRQPTTNAASAAGVVQGLYRLFIYLGDLYRYSSAYAFAQDCYEKATKLAPGKGNPYNQLAVVAQLKQDVRTPLSLVAMYYYSRSLLAVHDPFDTSKGNLEKLFDDNRQWLQSNSEQSLLLQQQQEQLKNKNNKGKTAAAATAASSSSSKVERTRTIRSIQSRLFLSRLVDVHYDFYVVKVHAAYEQRQAHDVELVQKMSVVLQKLDALLREWAFGDALLMKMVTVHAFSIEWTQSKTLARAFLLRFGAAVAERLEHALHKAMEKQKKDAVSVRLLMPLVLVCDYVSTWTYDDDSPDRALTSDARNFCVDAKQRYWTHIASVATKLLPLRISLGLDEMLTSSSSSSSLNAPLREYEALVGYKPFDSFVNTSDSDEAYRSLDDAVRVLDLASTAPTSTQTSDDNKSTNSTSGIENALKLKRFFDILDTMVEKKQPICCVNGQYRVFAQNKSDHDSIVDDDDDDNVMMDEDDPIVEFESSEVDVEKEPKAAAVPPRVPIKPVAVVPTAPPLQMDDVLEYKQSEGGAGPALLVPGALLLNKVQEKTASPRAAKQTVPPPAAAVVTTDRAAPMDTSPDVVQQVILPSTSRPATDVTMEERPPPSSAATVPLGPPPGILPPPGFGTAPPPLAPAKESTAQALQPSFIGRYPTFPSSSSQSPSDGDTVWQLLQGMDTNTANPFMRLNNETTTTSRLFPSLEMSSNDTSENDVDGVSLLDSSLLNSMMMDDSTTQPRSKNPFLT